MVTSETKKSRLGGAFLDAAAYSSGALTQNLDWSGLEWSGLLLLLCNWWADRLRSDNLGTVSLSFVGEGGVMLPSLFFFKKKIPFQKVDYVS